MEYVASQLHPTFSMHSCITDSVGGIGEREQDSQSYVTIYILLQLAEKGYTEAVSIVLVYSYTSYRVGSLLLANNAS